MSSAKGSTHHIHRPKGYHTEDFITLLYSVIYDIEDFRSCYRLQMKISYKLAGYSTRLQYSMKTVVEFPLQSLSTLTPGGRVGHTNNNAKSNE